MTAGTMLRDGLQSVDQSATMLNMTNETTYDIEPGDCFACSWGYDQTQVYYYRIDRVLPKSVEITPIGAQIVDTPCKTMQRTVPNPFQVREHDVLTDRRKTMRFKVYRNTWNGADDPVIVIDSNRHFAHPVRGAAAETHPMFGR